MGQQLLIKPLTENAVGQPLEIGANESEASAPFDFEYRPIPPPRVLAVKARIQTISVGKPMHYGFSEEE